MIGADRERGLTIGPAAKAAGVGVETIRFYEREQLIDRPPTPASGRRTYPPDLVARIRFIQETQRLGFSLPEVRELLAIEDGSGPQVAERAARKIAEVRGKIRALRRLADRLQVLTEGS